MKRLIFIVLILVPVSLAVFASDILLLVNGDEYIGRLIRTSDTEVSFQVKGNSFINDNPKKVIVPREKVYMIKTDKRGTTFFINDNRRLAESVKIDKGADIIYLLSGKEIPAWRITIEDEIINYLTDKKKERVNKNIKSIPCSEVFLIKYADGSKDIFNEPNVDKKNTASHVAEDAKPQIKVIFYTTVKGDSIQSIADKYDVTPAQIIEWNELPSTATGKYVLKVGTQLMLQIKVTDKN